MAPNQFGIWFIYHPWETCSVVKMRASRTGEATKRLFGYESNIIFIYYLSSFNIHQREFLRRFRTSLLWHAAIKNYYIISRTPLANVYTYVHNNITYCILPNCRIICDKFKSDEDNGTFTSSGQIAHFTRFFRSYVTRERFQSMICTLLYLMFN